MTDEQIDNIFKCYRKEFSEAEGLHMAIDDYNKAVCLSKYIGEELSSKLQNAIYEYYNTIV